mmetsp:Transcript_18515/g.22793  ORF Transcript_18515/g.22793 Transcript_18515/m.22793 type:complete len:188 (-) Transcript_18515:46-609(-)
MVKLVYVLAIILYYQQTFGTDILTEQQLGSMGMETVGSILRKNVLKESIPKFSNPPEFDKEICPRGCSEHFNFPDMTHLILKDKTKKGYLIQFWYCVGVSENCHFVASNLASVTIHNHDESRQKKLFIVNRGADLEIKGATPDAAFGRGVPDSSHGRGHDDIVYAGRDIGDHSRADANPVRRGRPRR